MTARQILRRLHIEYNDFINNPHEQFSAVPVDPKDPFEWIAMIIGPKNTPYEGGKFYLNIKIPIDYPFKPPIVRFRTKIHHPIVLESGEICLDILNSCWVPNIDIKKILEAIM